MKTGCGPTRAFSPVTARTADIPPSLSTSSGRATDPIFGAARFAPMLASSKGILEATADLLARAMSGRFQARILWYEDAERIDDPPDPLDSTALSSVTSMALAGTAGVISLRSIFFGGSNALVAPEDVPLSFRAYPVNAVPNSLLE